MMSKYFVLGCVAVVALAMAPPVAADPVNAFEATTSHGNQLLKGYALGLDFDVNTQVRITSLGIFDDAGDGLLTEHYVAIYDRTTELPVVAVKIPAGGGTLIDGYRYVDLSSSVYLTPGFKGSIVAGYGGSNRDHNGNTHGNLHLAPAPSWHGLPWMDNVGIARYGTGAFDYPDVPDTLYGGGPANRYHAGSFRFAPNPEPGTLLLLSSILAAAGAVRRKRKQRSAKAEA